MQETRDTMPDQDSITFGWALFEAIPDCVKLLDPDGAILAMNCNGRSMMEIDDIAHLRGEPWMTFWPAEAHEAVKAALDAARAGGTGHVVAACPTAKGTPKWWDVMITRTASHDGQGAHLLVISRDITQERKASEEREQLLRQVQAANIDSKRVVEQLRASEERYRTLFDSVDEGFCIFEMLFDEADRPIDYRFLEMNPTFEGHTGLKDAVGRTARDMLPGLDDFWFETYGRVALTGEPVRFENEAPAMNRWFDVYATRIGGPDSRKVALLFNDISARKLSESTLRQLADDLAEADRRKTEFLATLAHELRNPLAPIRNGLSVMRLSGDNPAAMAKVRDMMERQVGHMVHLIDDLLDIARISGGKLELKRQRTDLQSILASAVETSMPLIEAGQHELTIDVPDAALLVDADATRIAQVVANLLNNAAKYTPARGQITLSLRRDGGQAVIAVRDTGVGIAGDALAGVFEMFSQIGRTVDRSQGGLGIGLSLVRRLVEMHGGSVAATSAGANAGSIFTVRLPLAAEEAQASAAPGEHPPALDGAAGGLKVLVVDDNVDAAVTLSMILDMSGHTARVAHDGYEALAMAQAFQPRVAFLDIGMPGMSGYETARAMRATAGLEDIVLVALTGWGAESDRLRSNEAGFDHHLTKPVQLDVVEALLAGL
ncbi:ATP-binding protein [Massilia aurea]|uniref:PAS domain-containing hybrid sensor histidine kinase/response regulator n=1 Tax=Massilia aurea TaxID=373040 RepID=UPI0034633A88